MIQRVQNLYLFLVAVVAIVLLFSPIYHLKKLSGEVVSTFDAHGLSVGDGAKYPFYLAFILMALLAIAGLFLFKNRKKQLLVSRLNLIVHVLVALVFLLFAILGGDFLKSQLTNYDESNLMLTYGIGYYLTFIGVPLLLLSIRGIRKDEALLRSIDRIR